MNIRRVESFLLRIVVAEDEAPHPEAWRGRIQHIASGTELQIDDLSHAVAFIVAHLGPLAALPYAIEEESIGSTHR